jgi:hypothetical protein
MGMKRPLTVTLASLIGAFGIYCSQSAVTDGDRDGGASSGGPVGEASADSPTVPSAGCCTTPVPKFKPLGELTVTDTTKSAIVAVGAYREIVIYRVADTKLNGTCIGPSSGLVEATFRSDASGAFGYVGGGDSGRFAVQGSDLQLRFRSAGCPGSATYQVAGVE